MSRNIRILLAIGLFLMLMPSTVLAQNDADQGPVPPPPTEKDKVIGSVFSPPVRSDMPAKGERAALAMPGGGYCWGQAGLQWYGPIYHIDAIAKTGIVDTTQSFYLRARVINLFKDGGDTGVTAFEDVWADGTFTLQAVGTWWGWIWGAFWDSETGHSVTDFESFDWNTTSGAAVQL